jgi:hypothetical protein
MNGKGILGAGSTLVAIATLLIAVVPHLGGSSVVEDKMTAAWNSNSSIEIAKFQDAERTEIAIGDPVVTDFASQLPCGEMVTVQPTAKLTVLPNGDAYVLVYRAPNGDVSVSTDSATRDLGILDHPVTVSKLTGLPVPAATVALAVDHYTIRSQPQAPTQTAHAVSTNHLVVKKLDTQIAPVANGVINWLNSIKNLFSA